MEELLLISQKERQSALTVELIPSKMINQILKGHFNLDETEVI